MILILTDLPGWYQREIIWFMSNKEEMIYVYKINQIQNKATIPHKIKKRITTYSIISFVN